MRVNANAVLRSWTLLAAFGGSYAPGHTCIIPYISIEFNLKDMNTNLAKLFNT